MRTITVVLMIAVSLIATSSFGEDARSSGSGDRQWLSIPQIHAKLETAGYRNIEKIERKHGGYEIRATDRDGQRVKVYLNPITGDTSDRRGNKHDKFHRGDARNSPDCNERRCRDDLPEPVTAARPARN